MAPMKRPAAKAKKTAPSQANKRVKRDSNLAELSAIMFAVANANGYPSEVVGMLADNLESILLVFKEDRHPFQHQVVAMVGDVLKSERASAERDVEELEAKLAASAQELAARVEAVTAAKAQAEARRRATEAKRAELAEAASHAVAKFAAVGEARADRREADAPSAVLASRHSELEAVFSGDYVALKRGDAPSAAKATKAVVKVCSDFAFDAQLCLSAETALGKAVSERGSFDIMVLEQLELQFRSRIAALEAELAEGEPAKAERAAKFATAEAELAAAKDRQEACHTAAEAAKIAADEASAELNSREKWLQDFGPEMQKVETDLEKARRKKAVLDEVVGFYEHLKERDAGEEARLAASAAEAAAAAQTAAKGASAAMKAAVPLLAEESDPVLVDAV